MKYRFRILFGVLPFTALLFSSCTSAMEQAAGAKSYGPQVEDLCAPPSPNRLDVSREAAVSSAARNRSFEVSKDRKMVYQANLVLNCQDVPEAIRKAGEIARKYHGYAVQRDNVMIRVKIPVESADTVLTELEALGKVIDRKITAQDVTEQYVDTQVRIENLRRSHV